MPLNKASSAQLITGIAFPLQGDTDLVHEPRFVYLFSGGANNKTGDDDHGASGKDQAIRAFALLRRSDADAATLAKACVEVLPDPAPRLPSSCGTRCVWSSVPS
jgi:hypothetical protein